MSRPGVTYLEVAQAATALVQKNIRPSIEEVRKSLGTGSNSTINRHLREWRERQGHDLEAKQGLPDSLLIAVKGIYAAMQDDAEQKILELTRLHEEQAIQLKHALDQSQRMQQQLSETLAQTQIQCSELETIRLQQSHALQNCEQALELKQLENTGLQQRLEDKLAEISRLSQELLQTQRNLEHYRETVRQHREEERAQYQATLNQFTQQQSEQKQLYQALEEQHEQLKRHYYTVQEDFRQCTQALRATTESQHAAQLQVQQLETSLQAESRYHDELKAAHEQLVAEHSCTKQSYQEASLQLERTQDQVNWLTSALQKAEQRIHELTDRNVFLTQEKTELLTQLKLIKI